MSSQAPQSTYRQIIKSSALIGGSSVVSVLAGIIRMKFAAVLLGPTGVGLLGAYTTILAPLALLAGMGITSSGVRLIAEATGKNDQNKVARATLVVKRTSRVCGGLGVLLTLLLAYPLSLSMFGDSSHAMALGVLAVTLFLGAVAGGFGAILQGLRRVRDMAAKTSLDAVFGLPIAIALMATWGIDAIVPMLCATAVLGLAITWWFSRRIDMVPIAMTWRETWREAMPMLKLGLVFMGSGLLTAAVAYVIRLLIIRQLGLDASGIYSAAWTLSSYYVGFILSAMGADFYPRLVGVNKDNLEVNRMVNEQTEVGLLIALPGIFATLGLAPILIDLFYTSRFLPAVELLQWQTLGVLLRVISWPIGYILLAKSAKGWFLFSELASNLLLLVLTWLGIRFFSLNGLGIAFLAMYICYTALIQAIAFHVSGFTWSAATMRLIVIALPVSALALVAARSLPILWNVALGSLLALLSACYSCRKLAALSGMNPLTSVLTKLRGATSAMANLANRLWHTDAK